MHLKPTVNLVFGRNLGSTPAATFIQLNSLNAAASNTIYPAYPEYPSPFANPYPVYPQYEEIPANRFGVNHNPLGGGQPQGQKAPILENHMQPAQQMPQAQHMPANVLNPLANLQHQQQPMLPIQRQMLPFERPPYVAPNLMQHPGHVPQMPVLRFRIPQPQMSQAPLHRNTFPYENPLLHSPKDDPFGDSNVCSSPPDNHPLMDNIKPHQLNSPLESSTPTIEQIFHVLAKKLPEPECQIKSPMSEAYLTPKSRSSKIAANQVASDSSSSVLGNEDVWKLSHIPTPTKVIDFNELPTNAKTFTQMQGRLERKGSGSC